MTAIYIHPCYLANIIYFTLLPDNDIYNIVTEIYAQESSLRVGYLVTYALRALERDISRSYIFEKMDLKRLPSETVIIEETKAQKEKEKRRK
jgi:hypothetical protein